MECHGRKVEQFFYLYMYTLHLDNYYEDLSQNPENPNVSVRFNTGRFSWSICLDNLTQCDKP